MFAVCDQVAPGSCTDGPAGAVLRKRAPSTHRERPRRHYPKQRADWLHFRERVSSGSLRGRAKTVPQRRRLYTPSRAFHISNWPNSLRDSRLLLLRGFESNSRVSNGRNKHTAALTTAKGGSDEKPKKPSAISIQSDPGTDRLLDLDDSTISLCGSGSTCGQSGPRH